MQQNQGQPKYFTDINDPELSYLKAKVEPIKLEAFEQGLEDMCDQLVINRLPNLADDMSIIFDPSIGNVGAKLIHAREHYQDKLKTQMQSILGQVLSKGMLDTVRNTDLEFLGEFGIANYSLIKMIRRAELYMMAIYTSKPKSDLDLDLDLMLDLNGEGSEEPPEVDPNDPDDYLILKWLGYPSIQDIFDLEIKYSDDFRVIVTEIIINKIEHYFESREAAENYVETVSKNYRICFTRNKLESGFAANSDDLAI